ncbi:MAG: hypothetical protein ABW133_09755 [Polyangiaceae bacterium]
MKHIPRAFLLAFTSLLAARASFAEAPREPSPDPRAASRPAERILASDPSAPLVPIADAEVSRSGVAPEPNGDYARTPAFEVNVLWPFFPGGIVDLKGLFPVVRSDRRDFRGEIIAGVHSDFGWGPVSRPVDKYGKVSILAAKVGYRQFLVYGTHLDVSVNLGWRHEEENIYDGERLDAFIGRLWMFAGYQHELSTRVYVNIRGGGGLHLFRTDRYADTERKFAPAGDVNLGVRF